MKKRSTFFLVAAVAMFSCNKNECSPENLQRLASEAITANLNEGVDPAYKWVESDLLGDIYLIGGTVTINGPNGARVVRETVARVWCNGSGPAEVTMVDVEGLIKMKMSNEAGRDTALTRTEREYAEELARIQAALDSITVAAEKSLQNSQHFLDSINKQ